MKKEEVLKSSEVRMLRLRSVETPACVLIPPGVPLQLSVSQKHMWPALPASSMHT